MTTTTDSGLRRGDCQAGPLAGVRVLELGNMIAGPTAGVLFADFGADVVKVELPGVGDDLRSLPPHKGTVPLWWKVTNRNKTLITLDLRTDRGQQLLKRMVPHFDIVIENFRPGTLERWGLGFDSLAKLNVGLILARISGYGQTGPYAMRPGYGTVAEAMSGVPSFTGFPDKPPTLSAFTLVDALAGLFAVQGALMALYERNTSGCGQVVDVSLFESLFRLVDPQVIAYDQLAQIKPRQGNRLTGDSPRNAYRTLDGRYITISAGSKRTFARLASAIGMPELANDPRFADVQSRCANVDELDQIISQWFEARSMPEAMTMLEEHDVVAGPVYDIADIFDDPQYRAREDIVSIDDPDLGTVRMQGIVPKLSRTPGAVIHTGGAMGEGNEAFYTTIGLTEREITELRAEGVI